MSNCKCLVGELTLVVRKEAARIKDKRPVVIDINPYICVL